MVQVDKIGGDNHSLVSKRARKVSNDIFEAAGLKQVKYFFNMLLIKMWNSLPQDIMKNKGRDGFRQIYRKNKKSFRGC